MAQLDPERMIDLTEPWSPASWPYPGHPPASEGVVQTLARDRINTWKVETSMHTGTHVDAPLHCAGGGADMASVPLTQLVRPGYVADLSDLVEDWHVVTPADVESRLPGPLEEGDALILRYGWQRFGKGHEEEDRERFFDRHPGPGRALVQWALDRRLAWIGTDSPSFEHPANIALRRSRPDLVPEMEAAVGGSEVFDQDSWMLAHRRLLGAGALHVDQAGGDLAAVPDARVTLAAFPWRYAGGEASICRLVAIP